MNKKKMWTCQFFQDGITQLAYEKQLASPKKNQKEVIVQAFVGYDTLLHMAYIPYPHQMEFYSLDFMEQEQINLKETLEIQDSIEYFLSFLLLSKQDFIWWYQKENKKKNNQRTFLYEHQNQKVVKEEEQEEEQEEIQEEVQEEIQEEVQNQEQELEQENNNQTFIDRYEYGLCRFCLTLK
jgi:hypothetical protein